MENKWNIQLSFDTGITYPKADAAGTPLTDWNIWCTGHVCHEYPFKHYKKDTSTICLRQKCDHQVDACTTPKVLCAWGTAYSTVYLHILASTKCNTSVCNDKYRRLETDTDSTLDTEASLKLPWSLAKQSWQTSLAVKNQTASTLVSDGACSCMKFE